jgi:hypothetical protein
MKSTNCCIGRNRRRNFAPDEINVLCHGRRLRAVHHRNDAAPSLVVRVSVRLRPLAASVRTGAPRRARLSSQSSQTTGPRAKPQPALFRMMCAELAKKMGGSSRVRDEEGWVQCTPLYRRRRNSPTQTGAPREERACPNDGLVAARGQNRSRLCQYGSSGGDSPVMRAHQCVTRQKAAPRETALYQ